MKHLALALGLAFGGSQIGAQFPNALAPNPAPVIPVALSSGKIARVYSVVIGQGSSGNGLSLYAQTPTPARDTSRVARDAREIADSYMDFAKQHNANRIVVSFCRGGRCPESDEVAREVLHFVRTATGAWQRDMTVRPMAPSSVDITWMSITNMYYEIGPLRVLTDGYITRIPRGEFFGGGGGYAQTHTPQKPDAAAVTRVMDALGGPHSVDVLLTGHSHFDHSFDTGTWSRLTGARVIGSKTTCFQVRAQGIPAARCTPVDGGDTFELAEGVKMYVVRWNHSGDPRVNPEQHNPVELLGVPGLDSATGGLRAGVAEDFPNGGGNRAFLFVVDGPGGRLSWFFNNSASAVDLEGPIVVDGVDYGAPIENLERAMHLAGLTSVDLWIGAGNVDVARMVLPILRPKVMIPVHWDDFFTPFADGVTRPYSDPAMQAYLAKEGIAVFAPKQVMDKWRLDRTGLHAVDNATVKGKLGFK